MPPRNRDERTGKYLTKLTPDTKAAILEALASGVPPEAEAMHADGATYSCPCGRTRLTSLLDGKLEQLDLPTVDLGLPPEGALQPRVAEAQRKALGEQPLEGAVT